MSRKGDEKSTKCASSFIDLFFVYILEYNFKLFHAVLIFLKNIHSFFSQTEDKIRIITMPAALEDHGIRDVWASNMEEELRNISRVVKTHRYIAMVRDTAAICCYRIRFFF